MFECRRWGLASLLLLLGCARPRTPPPAEAPTFDHLFELVQEGVVALPSAQVVTGYALGPDLSVYCVDPKTRLVWRTLNGKVVATYGIEDSHKILRNPWHLTWSSSGLYVADRDPEHPAIFVLDPETAATRRKLDLPATPSIGVFPDGNLLLGYRHLFEEGNMDMLHVYAERGEHIRSFFPNDPRDQEEHPFGSAHANELSFDVTEDGVVYAVQAYDQQVRIYNEDGKETGAFHGECPESRAPNFSTPPTTRDWDQEAWGRWRDSWTRLIAVHATGGYIVTHTIKAVGKPGWIDVYNARGDRVLGCADLQKWPVASTNDLILFTKREGEGKADFRYWIYRAKSSGLDTRQNKSIPECDVYDSAGRKSALRSLMTKKSTLLVMIHPDTCAACMEEKAQWRELALQGCDELKMLGIVFGMSSTEELAEFERYLALPFPLYWDKEEVLRHTDWREIERDGLPYKLLVSQEGVVLGEWGARSVYDEQVEVRREIEIATSCSNNDSARRQ